MTYSGVVKHVEFNCYDLDMHDEFDVEVPIQEDFNDILAYYFEKHYEVPFVETQWLIEEGAREFVKDLEDKWLHNQIDTFELYHNREFLDFLERRYNDSSYEFINEKIEDAYSEFLTNCKHEARYMDRSDLKKLVEDTNGIVELDMFIDNVYYSPIESTIDIAEIYDSEWGDLEEEEEEEE